jgi:type ISP restriction-modification system protein
VRPGLLARLAAIYAQAVTPEDVLAYLAAVAAHPAYVRRFEADLVQPGLRIPVTAEAARLGREVVWLHTFGERFAAPAENHPASPPRLPQGEGPRIPEGGTIPSSPDAMPDAISYDPASRRLRIGAGYVDNVPPEVWNYEVAGKQVLTQWFSYRRRNRSRPLIGDRPPPSPLGDIQPQGWPAEYTTELLNVLHVLGRLVALEPAQARLLDRICAGPTIAADDLRQPVDPRRAGGLKRGTGKPRNSRQMKLLD